MSWLNNRNREGQETDNTEVRPRIQILQVPPEKVTPEAKGKLNKPGELSDEEKQKQKDTQIKLAEKYRNQDKPAANSEGDTTKGQRIMESGKETQIER